MNLSVFKRFVIWLRVAFAPDPQEVQRELLRLMIRAGRRCAHDLAHAAEELELPPSQRSFDAETWRKRAEMWRQVFYPTNGPKDYRDELHRKIFDLEAEVARLRELCKDNGHEIEEKL